MGNQKVAARRKPTTDRSGTRKSSKENNGSESEPPSHGASAKKPYPKARLMYKKVASAEDSIEAGKAHKGEAEAAAALVSMQNRGQTVTGQSAFDSEYTYQKVSKVPDDGDSDDLNEPSEDKDASVEEDELEEDQLIDGENEDDEGKRLNVPVIPLDVDSY